VSLSAKGPNKDRERLIPSGRLRTLGQGYTWFVRITKLLLPIAAIVIVGIVIARLSTDPQEQNITELPKKDQTAAGNIELEKARYEGVDAEGRSYTLSAESASRAVDDPNTVLLDKPQADVTLANGQWIAAHATKGTYNTEASVISLSGGVNIFHDSGYEMITPAVDINLKTQEAETKGTVSLRGPEGKLTAVSMKIEQGGNMIIFTGPAKALINIKSRGARG
jgi:lipopolysaccharide export system protein LptC